jgi:hypothetical protein
MVIAATNAKLFTGPDGLVAYAVRIKRPITVVRDHMDASNHINEPTPQDSLDAEQHVVDITRMSHDSAHTYMEFHTGMRWLRRRDDDVV